MGLAHAYSDNSWFIRLEADDIINRYLISSIDKTVTQEVAL